MTNDLDARVRLAVYRHFAETAKRPAIGPLARSLDLTVDDVKSSYARLFANRALVVDADGETIRMAPPFSGVPTQHRVRLDGKEYFANCAWDSLGIVAALRKPGTVHSRCERSGEPLRLDIALDAPPQSDWVFHCAVPAAQWWKDIVFT